MTLLSPLVTGQGSSCSSAAVMLIRGKQAYPLLSAERLQMRLEERFTAEVRPWEGLPGGCFAGTLPWSHFRGGLCQEQAGAEPSGKLKEAPSHGSSKPTVSFFFFFFQERT